jgi:hypothetical protein
MNVGPDVPTDILELRAAEERRRLHNSVSELRERVRESLDINRLARQYVVPATGAAAVIGLVMGYGVGGFFTR